MGRPPSQKGKNKYENNNYKKRFTIVIKMYSVYLLPILVCVLLVAKINLFYYFIMYSTPIDYSILTLVTHILSLL